MVKKVFVTSKRQQKGIRATLFIKATGANSFFFRCWFDETSRGIELRGIVTVGNSDQLSSHRNIHLRKHLSGASNPNRENWFTSCRYTLLAIPLTDRGFGRAIDFVVYGKPLIDSYLGDLHLRPIWWELKVKNRNYNV